MRRGHVASAALVAAMFLVPGVSGSSPCPLFLYSVSYASPLCFATITSPTNGIALSRLWWPEIWNGTANLSTGEGLDRASDHLGHEASSLERVTVLDRDRDLNLSEGDAITVWAPTGCPGSFLLYLGSDPASLGAAQGLNLKEGFAQSCGSAPRDPVTPILVVLILAAAFAISAVAIVLLRRRIPRG